MKPIKRQKHVSFIDPWSILHIVVTYFITASLIYLGIQPFVALVILLIIGLVYEFIEQEYLVGIIFNQRETLGNSASDIIMDMVGGFLAVLGSII